MAPLKSKSKPKVKKVPKKKSKKAAVTGADELTQTLENIDNNIQEDAMGAETQNIRSVAASDRESNLNNELGDEQATQGEVNVEKPEANAEKAATVLNEPEMKEHVSRPKTRKKAVSPSGPLAKVDSGLRAPRRPATPTGANLKVGSAGLKSQVAVLMPEKQAGVSATDTTAAVNRGTNSVTAVAVNRRTNSGTVKQSSKSTPKIAPRPSKKSGATLSNRATSLGEILYAAAQEAIADKDSGESGKGKGRKPGQRARKAKGIATVPITPKRNQLQLDAPTAPFNQSSIPPPSSDLSSIVGKPDLYRTTIDLNGFPNENISLDLDGRQLIVVAYREKDKSNHARKVTEVIDIPDNVNMDSIMVARRTDGYLTIAEVPSNLPIQNK